MTTLFLKMLFPFSIIFQNIDGFPSITIFKIYFIIHERKIISGKNHEIYKPRKK